MPWFFPPHSMVVRRGHCIAGISRNAWCTWNFRPAKETKVDQNCGIKIRSKPISSGTTSIREIWRDMPWTGQNGKAQFTKLLLTLKRFGAKNLLLPERDTAEQPRQWSQQLTSSDPTVQDSVPLGWGCGAISVLIDELYNANVIIGSDGQSLYIYMKEYQEYDMVLSDSNLALWVRRNETLALKPHLIRLICWRNIC